ncbi:hypothetical protein QJ856_gp1150 [Tupanvirus deep ocean]|uniref:Uncharacterized protein n=2 Tax=Tupanvirus TaxID=2094720 RepID=A0AC62A7K7_9VIRU|nr:hypothetical protein QJ856_gp1150 [Tupanvirus deep ocean]QKU33608.1 hypothetical protein [Tupanvirus deep ocean]
MYFIKKITLKDGKEYVSSQIVGHTKNKIAGALVLLDSVAREFVKEEYGAKAYEQSKILDIHKIEQVCEPIVDGMLLYRLNDDPHRVHVYQRRTEVIDQNGWFSSAKIPVPQFKRTHIIELEQCESVSISETNANIASAIPSVEMVPLGPAGIKVPKPMTVAPICDLIDELKKCARFKARFISVNASNTANKPFVEVDKDTKISEVKAALTVTTVPSETSVIVDQYSEKNTNDASN